MRPLLALLRKELAVLFGSPVAWLALAMVGVVTAVQFFELLRVYNHQLFAASTPTIWPPPGCKSPCPPPTS